ncbi:MAG: ABC transporter permease, partial [Cyanobacteria bacterium]|nr:ABC transporter permease [Cyanobacteriota bacterium]
MQLPIEWYIAARYISSNIKQSIIVALAVGIGVSIIIFIPSVNLSFFDDLLTKTVEDYPHIRVTQEYNTTAQNQETLTAILPALLKELFPGVTLPGEVSDKSISQEALSPGDTPKIGKILFSDQTVPRRRNLTAYRRMMVELLKVPGVTDAAPYISEQVIVAHGSRVRGAGLRGVIPDKEKEISRIEEDIQEGNFDNLNGNQVFLGWRLADEIGVKVGQHVQLVTSRGTKSFKVTGLVKTGIYQQDMDTVMLSLQSAQNLLNMSNEVTGISLRLKDYYQAKILGNTIAKSYRVKTRSWMEDNEIILQQVANFRVIISFISFLIVFAAATSITSVLVMVVASKSKEIGILKAIGMKEMAIIRLFLIQAIFLSILGAMAGVLGGMVLIAVYNATPFAKA